MSALTLQAFQRRPLLWLPKLAAHAHHPIAGLYRTHWAMLTLLDFWCHPMLSHLAQQGDDVLASLNDVCSALPRRHLIRDEGAHPQRCPML